MSGGGIRVESDGKGDEVECVERVTVQRVSYTVMYPRDLRLKSRTAVQRNLAFPEDPG